ncbi:helix-turn-helix domain-containing protein [Streptomyces sp. NRRL F-5650]|jgi:peptidoglycan hydrolase-like protein with peptidoglycan-binding domain|uniref:helix-turn-helix domain-containing protein n=1 Tax=Streptomyces sp. NRRL F-5650 TaxID=1463868 RepID=UPI0004C4CDD8|nr:helix-turn-helix domain-containing protein [Streptomyces sp. NRRL F-5650]
MLRWKELPDSLDPRVRQLVVQLRRLKDRSGLSLESLETKTGISRSSWDRYLNGKTLPPRRAVEELARVSGADGVRLLVLHEVAEDAWKRQSAPSRPEGATAPAADVRGEEPVPVSDARPSTVRKGVALAAVAVAAVAGMGVGMAVSSAWHGERSADDQVKATVAAPGPSSTTTHAKVGGKPYVFRPGTSYPCEVRRSKATGEGLYAGYSVTRSAVLAGPGWDVVEAQCLLRHRHLEPGVVDGVYGQQTIAAVMRLQEKAGLPADGVVGPHTWQVLRG